MDNKFSNIKERILYLTDCYKISKELFFENIGMTYGSFKGSAKERPLNSDAIVKILSIYPEINAEWLLTGNGEMLKGISIVATKNNETIVFKELAEARLEIIVMKDKEIARLENLISELKYTVSNNPIVYSKVAEPPPELTKRIVSNTNEPQ